jgi:cysteine-S-conjugate beta-lyase
MYNLDNEIERKDTNSIKFDKLKVLFGREDILPMWVADMDFQSPPAIIEAIKKRAKHGVFGYSFRDDESVDSFIKWVEKRYDWHIDARHITSSPGIVTALALAVRIFTKNNDKILIQTPVYPPFFSVIKDNHRELVTSTLIKGKSSEGDDEYQVNWQEFEEKLSSGVKMFILCNSHNPVGKLWNKEELQRMGNLCLKHDVLIFSDEIHADLALNGNRHTVMASVSPEISANTITAMAPSKTFNIAGLLNSLIIAESPTLLEKFKQEIESLHLGMGNLFGHITLEPAYSQGEEWLKEVTDYITGNAQFAEKFLKNKAPQIKFIQPKSSFLLWLDFRDTKLSHKQIKDKLVNEALVGLNDGLAFGKCGEGFFRMNIGTTKARVEEALQRIAKVF